MKKITFVACFVLIFSIFSNAQGYEKGKLFLGPTFSLSYFGGLGMGASAIGEYGLGLWTDKLSIGGDIGFNSYHKRYDADWYWYQYTYTQIYVIPTVSYHFFTGNRFDPYGKVGVGLSIWSSRYSNEFGNTDNSGLYSPTHNPVEVTPLVAFGIRYWTSKVFILRAEAGYPFLMSVGFDFCVK